MTRRYDVSVKTLFLLDGDGINHRAGMVVRTEDGSLHQVEFQPTNETGSAVQMLDTAPILCEFKDSTSCKPFSIWNRNRYATSTSPG